MEPVAIVGMAGRFPGAPDVDALWTLLRDRRDAVTEVPRDRWNVDDVYAPLPPVPGKMCTRWGGFLDRAYEFDAPFFGISAREASFMDPQQRVILEVAWEALENAGIPPAALSGTSTGVFVGVSNYDYNRLICRDPATMDAYSSTGTILAITANRISYALNLRGPSLIIDTACSSSLVSLHIACQSLRGGECDVALAGGVNLIIAPEVTIILSQGGLMSPDGRCKAFDASANGYVRSEGCGMLVLKRLADAERDGDEVLALIRGSAVNQDGGTNGMTAPSGSAQQAVIRRALASAGLQAADLSCLEAHGTGTPLGDIIEWRALRAVLLENRPEGSRCAIASIKTNIGHTETAAGIAGVIKIVLALRHAAIPAHLHLREPNRHLKLSDESPMFIPTETMPWPSNGTPRIAGVSSFGIGGTNAHLIVEEAPPRPAAASGAMDAPLLFPVSAKTEEALQANLRNYARFLSGGEEQPLNDLCFTAAAGRMHYRHRAIFACRSVDELHRQLESREAAPDDATARRYLSGEEIDWKAYYGTGHRIVPLPAYAFAPTTYWFSDYAREPSPT
jgi:acyl transferase domain-containing protein